MAGLLTPAGFDPTSPLIPPTVPMSQGGITVQGPHVNRTVTGELEQGSSGRIDDALQSQVNAAKAEADAKAAQNEVQAARLRKEAEIEKQANDRLVAEQAARDAEIKKRQDAYDAEVRSYEAKHSGDRSWGAKGPLGDKIVAAVAVALGGIGMAIARRPGENPALGIVNAKINDWYAEQNRQMEQDQAKLARTKLSIEDQNKYFDKRRMQIEAQKQALLTQTAKEFEAQGAIAKNPEIKAAAEQNAAKFKLEAEKQREFVMNGQRASVTEPTVTATRMNSGPSAEWAGMPGAPKLPNVPGQTAPGAAAPAPVAGAATSAPAVRMDPNAAAGAKDPGEAMAKIMEAARKVTGETGAPASKVAPKSPTGTASGQSTAAEVVSRGQKKMPAVQTEGDGSLVLPDGRVVDKRVAQNSGVLFGYQGKPVGIIPNKEKAEKVNDEVHGLADFRNETLRLKKAAFAVRDAKTLQEKNQAAAKFDAVLHNVSTKGKLMVGDALQAAEVERVQGATWESVVRGTVDTSIKAMVSAIDGKVASKYSAVGINPKQAMPILYGQEQAATSPAAASGRTVVRTGTNKAGKRVVQYSDGAIEVQ